jgi:hypothetical protein
MTTHKHSRRAREHEKSRMSMKVRNVYRDRLRNVGILNEGKSIICDLVDKQNTLVVRSMIYASLIEFLLEIMANMMIFAKAGNLTL